MKRVVIVICVALLAATCFVTDTLAQVSGTIDIFYVDPVTGMVDLGACQGNAIFAPPFTALFFAQVYLRLAGASAGGISGIEGFIDGIQNTGWAGTFTPVAGVVADGSFTQPRDTDGDTIEDTRRGNFAFAGVTGERPEDGCQIGDEGFLKLGDLQLSQSPVTSPIPNDTRLQFVAGDPPSGVLDCPLVTLCDAPVFSAICVYGGQFFINPVNIDCNPAVEGETWGGVKILYR